MSLTPLMQGESSADFLMSESNEYKWIIFWHKEKAKPNVLPLN